mgnify:CR=1 FL=1
MGERPGEAIKKARFWGGGLFCFYTMDFNLVLQCLAGMGALVLFLHAAGGHMGVDLCG